METLNSNPVASGRGVNEELLGLHPQDDDDLADVLPDPCFLPRIKLHASEVDIMEVARCARKPDPHDKVPMEPTMYGWLATAMTTTVSRMHATPNGDDGEDEPVWSIELASLWARFNAACGSHALAKSEPLTTTWPDHNHVRP
jgi:hypothetical protein